MMLGCSITTLLVFANFVTSVRSSQKTPLYRLDVDWKPDFPPGSHTFSGVAVAPDNTVFVTQRGNRTIDPVLVLDTDTGAFLRSWGAHFVGLDESQGYAKATWGAHGIGVQRWKSRNTDDGPAFMVWVDDFTNFTLSAFDAFGNRIKELGTNGVEGNGTRPTLQFGHVADTTFGANGEVFASDGDGGSANRVVGLRTSFEDVELTTKFLWATTPKHTDTRFNNPHSLTYHSPTGTIIVCDRDNNATRILRAEDGADLGTLDCGLDLGVNGKPFGIRSLQLKGFDLLFLALMDNPQDQRNQQIVIIDASRLDGKGNSTRIHRCTILQRIQINSDVYSGPHLLDVDPRTGTLYAALVADTPESTVLRFNMIPQVSSDKRDTYELNI